MIPVRLMQVMPTSFPSSRPTILFSNPVQKLAYRSNRVKMVGSDPSRYAGLSMHGQDPARRRRGTREALRGYEQVNLTQP